MKTQEVDIKAQYQPKVLGFIIQKSQQVLTASDQYFLSYHAKKTKGGNHCDPPPQSKKGLNNFKNYGRRHLNYLPTVMLRGTPCSLHFNISDTCLGFWIISSVKSWFMTSQNQGNNARKVISEVYAFLVLQCTVSGRKSKQNGCHSLTWDPFSQKQYIKYSGHRKLLCELSKFSKLYAYILFRYYRRTMMHLFLFTNYAQRKLVSICMQSIRNSN